MITTSSPTGPGRIPIENMDKWAAQWETKAPVGARPRFRLSISDTALNGGGLGQQGETWGDFGRKAAEKAGPGGKVYLAAGHGVDANTAKGTPGNPPEVGVDLIQGRDSLALVPAVLDSGVEAADDDMILHPKKYSDAEIKADPVKGLAKFKELYKAAQDRKQTRKAIAGFSKALVKNSVSEVEILACYVGYGAVGKKFVKDLATKLGVKVIAASVYLDTKSAPTGEVSVRYEYDPSSTDPDKVASAKWTNGVTTPKGDVSAKP